LKFKYFDHIVITELVATISLLLLYREIICLIIPPPLIIPMFSFDQTVSISSPQHLCPPAQQSSPLAQITPTLKHISFILPVDPVDPHLLHNPVQVSSQLPPPFILTRYLSTST